MVGAVLKVGLWLVALYAVFSFAQTPAVSNALMLFFTIGAVPGTDIVLTPHQTFIWLGVAFVVTLLLVFGTNIYRGLAWIAGYKQRARMAQELAGVNTLPVVQPMQSDSIRPVAAPRLSIAPLAVAATIKQLKAPQPRTVIDIKLPRKAGPLAKAFQAVKRPVVLGLAIIVLPLAWAVRVIAGGVHAVALHIVDMVRTAARWTAVRTRRVAHVIAAAATTAFWFSLKHAGNAAETTVDAAAIVVRIVWVILEPQLRSFDRYLEKRLNQNDIFRGIVATIADVKRTYESVRVQIRTRLGLSAED
ncbi:MAG TPA: hypothetical protein VLI54_04535 [Bacillota bacterium]|nr:hypothetical protein [Bacillota bacterium]